jgi:flagellar export protein FliJ
MKRFRFSLHALRTLRQLQEQRALKQFGLAIAARAQAARNLEEVRCHCNAGWQASRQSMKAGVTAAQMAGLGAYCRTMEALQRQAETTWRRTQRTVDERWEKLLTIRQQREAVDKYYQRQRGAYERQLSREEQKALDDMAHQRPARATAWKTEVAVEAN